MLTGQAQTCVACGRDEIKDSACKARVTKVKEIAASDIRFDIPLAEACYRDRQQFCANVQPGSARVIRCLQNRFVHCHTDNTECAGRSTISHVTV